jgi:hypothetical protein
MAFAGAEVKGQFNRRRLDSIETQTILVLKSDENAFSTKPLTNCARIS